MSSDEVRTCGPHERNVRPCDAERMAFEAWTKENRRELDLRYMYDEQGNYHYDGYIWDDTANAFRTWQAGAAWKAAEHRA